MNEGISIGLGNHEDGRCTVIVNLRCEEGEVTVQLNAVGARAYGNLLQQAAQEADRINCTAPKNKTTYGVEEE